MNLKLIAQHLVPALRQSLRAPGLCVIGLEGGRSASDEEREPWIRIKYGQASADDWVGVVPATVRFARERGVPTETLNLIVKINPRVGLARNLIPWIAARNHIVLERPFLQYRSASELDQTAAREFHVYRMALQQPELREVVPRCYGWAHDPETGEYALFLECVSDIVGLDATGAVADWEPEAIDAALRAAARWHAAFWGADEKRLGWAGPRPTTAGMVADTSLWRGLLNDSRARFPHIVTQEVWRRRYALIDTIGDWHKAKDTLPVTLVHNDFNQRNVGFRRNGHAPEPRPEPPPISATKINGRLTHRLLPRLFGGKKSHAVLDTAIQASAAAPAATSNQPTEVVVLDWEIAQRNFAARDLVELLTFALPPTVERETVDGHVETHRDALVKAGVATGVERDAFVEGFRCELRVQAINRVGLQLLFGAQFQLPYLARINATIERLLDLYE